MARGGEADKDDHADTGDRGAAGGEVAVAAVDGECPDIVDSFSCGPGEPVEGFSGWVPGAEASRLMRALSSIGAIGTT